MPTRAKPKSNDTPKTARRTRPGGEKQAKNGPTKPTSNKTEGTREAKQPAGARRVAAAPAPTAAPPPEEVRRRAFERYQARGREPGHDVDDWLEAEAELTSQHTR